MTLPGLASLLLGLAVFATHALRTGHNGLAAAVVALYGLFVWRRDVAPLILGPAALLAGLALAQVTGELIGFRLAAGLPHVRLTLIMSAAIALCLGGGLFAFSKPAAAFFKDGSRQSPRPPEAWFQAAAFWLTTGLLFTAWSKVPFPVLLADRFAPGWGALQIVLMGLYAAWLTGRMLHAQRTGPLRSRYWAFFSLIFFVQLGLGMLWSAKFLMTGALHLPVPALIAAGPVYRGSGFFMPILYLSTLLLVGPGWCSHLCYIGAADDACARLGRNTPKKLKLARLLPWCRAVTLLLTVGGALCLRMLGADWRTAVVLAAAFGILGLVVMTTLSRRTGVMIHCTAYCPIGLAGNILGRISPWRVRLAPGCDGCGRCTRTCRYLALTPEDLRKGRPGLSCTLCGDCVGACPSGRLRFHFPGLSPQNARAAYFTLVVALHAVFLGVARI